MPKGRRLPAAPVAIADVERAVKQLGGGEPVIRVLKALLKAMDKRRLNLHEHPASGALLEALVDVLNGDGDLRDKEVALAVLAQLSLIDENVEIVFGSLGRISAGFEAFLKATGELEASLPERLHLHLLTILFRGSGLRGQDVLELAEGDVTRALTMLQAVFRAHDLPHVVHVGAAQALLDLTRPDTYFSEDECTDSTSIRELTARYNANINALIRSTMGTGVLVDVCGLLKPWVAHSAITRKRFHGASAWLAPLAYVAGNVLAFIHNALTYSSESGAQLRRHLSVDTALIPEVVLPYLNLALDLWQGENRPSDTVSGAGVGASHAPDSDGTSSVSDGDSDGDDDGEGEGGRGGGHSSGTSAAWRAEMASHRGGDSSASASSKSCASHGADTLAALLPDISRQKMIADCLAVLVVATFKINMYRQFLLVDGTVQRVLGCSSLLSGDPVVLSLAVKLCVNMDVLKERKVKGAPKHKDASSRRVAALEGADAGEVLEEGAEVHAAVLALVLSLEPAKRKALQRLLLTVDNGAPMAVGCVTHQRLSFTFDDLHFKIEETEASVRKASGPLLAAASLDSAEYGSLGGDGGPGSPVAVSHTPRLGLSAVSMVEEWTALHVGRPAAESAAAGAPSTAASASAPAGAGLATPSATDDALSAAVSVSAAPSATSSGPLPSVLGVGAGSGGGRRLGALPTPLVRAPHFVAPMLRLGTVDPVGKPSAAQPPPILLCGLTKQLMSDPVRTPGGQVYDRAALEDYVSDHGKDPSTGEPLAMAAVTPAADVADEIRLYNFRQILGFRKLMKMKQAR